MPAARIRPQARHRVCARLWRTKLALYGVLSLAFCVPYFVIQHWPVFHIHSMPLLWLDRWIGFDPRWIYVYQSVYLLIPLTPWLATDRQHLWRYAKSFLLLCGSSFLIWVVFPIAAPRPSLTPHDGMWGVLLSYDGLINTLPSLHVGLATLAVLFGQASLPADMVIVKRLFLGALIIWTLLISYATLATKQHYAVDLPAGALLAWICHHYVWRNRPKAFQTPAWF